MIWCFTPQLQLKLSHMSAGDGFDRIPILFVWLLNFAVSLCKIAVSWTVIQFWFWFWFASLKFSVSVWSVGPYYMILLYDLWLMIISINKLQLQSIYCWGTENHVRGLIQSESGLKSCKLHTFFLLKIIIFLLTMILIIIFILEYWTIKCLVFTSFL